MKQVAFITSKKQSTLSLSDSLVVPLLSQRDIVVTAIPWGSRTHWGTFDMIVIRSAWDYPLQYKKFLLWLESLRNLPVWNSIPTLRWNIQKTYLSTMKNHHIPTVPTQIITSNDMIPKSFHPWTRIVVKPSIGAWAFEIKKFSENDTRGWSSHIRRLLTNGPVLVQEYMEDISNGEYSLIFFNKKYSHAVLKIPKKNEFRTRKTYGGSIISVVPPPAAIKTAQSILMGVAEPLLYARIDGLFINKSFTLMEIELCEPELFLDTHPLAPQNFCDAIVQYLL